jgi:hypothetical protein
MLYQGRVQYADRSRGVGKGISRGLKSLEEVVIKEPSDFGEWDIVLMGQETALVGHQGLGSKKEGVRIEGLRNPEELLCKPGHKPIF